MYAFETDHTVPVGLYRPCSYLAHDIDSIRIELNEPIRNIDTRPSTGRLGGTQRTRDPTSIAIRIP